MTRTIATSTSPGVALAVVALLVSGCAHEALVYPTPSPQNYAVNFTTARSSVGGVVADQSTALAPDTATVLRRGRRVAFLPPDRCQTTSVTPNGAAVNETAILMDCGALLAALEAEAAKLGYAVVSWQALKVGGSAGAVGEARALHVDVLFEINELSQGPRDAGQQQVADMKFLRDTALDGHKGWAPVDVQRVTADRCADRFLQNLKPGRDFLSTVNLKATELASGRAVWLYQHSVVEHEGEADQNNERQLVYADPGVMPPPPPADDTGTNFFAAVPIGAGIGLLIAIPAIENDDLEGALPPILGGAGVGLVVGVVGNGLWYLLTMPDTTPPKATYRSPDDVVCNGDPVYDSWAQRAAPTNEQAASSYTSHTRVAAASNVDAERSERLRQRSMKEFADALAAIAAPAR